MCSQSVSGSSLLSGYDDDDIRETSGRSRRDFEQIDAVLYDEEVAKRSSIKKICEEWSSKPHFRIRGSVCSIDRRSSDISRIERTIVSQTATTTAATPTMSTSSTVDLPSSPLKLSSFNTSELNIFTDDTISGRSSVDSTEGSELTNNADFDDDDEEADTINPSLDNRFAGGTADSFDTDDDDDDNLSDMSKHNRSKHSSFLLRCVKDNILNSLTSLLLGQFLSEQQTSFQRYAKMVCKKNSVQLRPKLRPSSLPPRPLSRNRLSLPTASSIISSNSAYHQPMLTASMPFRATPEPNRELTSLLLVKQLRHPQTSTTSSSTVSPRKSQVTVAPPTPVSALPSHPEKNFDRRNQSQQSISLVGTAVVNLPLQSTTSQPNPTTTRQAPSAWRYRSATTIISNVPNSEVNTRLPPISKDTLSINEPLAISRSNTISSSTVDFVPAVSRVVSSTSTGSNQLSSGKIRSLTSTGRLSRASRSLVGNSYMNKDNNNNHSSSTSPARSITTTAISPATLKTTAASRVHQQSQGSKRPLLTTKTSTPPTSSNSIKITATHVYQMTN